MNQAYDLTPVEIDAFPRRDKDMTRTLDIIGCWDNVARPAFCASAACKCGYLRLTATGDQKTATVRKMNIQKIGEYMQKDMESEISQLRKYLETLTDTNMPAAAQVFFCKMV